MDAAGTLAPEMSGLEQPRNAVTSDADPAPDVDADTLSQIQERLRWTPAQRLRYLRDMVDFERRAQAARRLS